MLNCDRHGNVTYKQTLNRVPTQTGKRGKMGRYFPVREKSGNFEQTGKVRENHTKYSKTEINWDKYYLIFLVIFKWTELVKMDQILSLKKKTFKKILENGKKYWKSQGILSVRKNGNPVEATRSVIDFNLFNKTLWPVVLCFREACCRQYEMGECTRGGFCNFMHLKPISRELRRQLYGRSRNKRRRSVHDDVTHSMTLMLLVHERIS